ncbi:MAG TPA: hypothetical protein VHP99_19965 [Pyrinomonadaceae bacterium]|nr:hypothetical protein [Pyrinomonadaceae bacterium]
MKRRHTFVLLLLALVCVGKIYAQTPPANSPQTSPRAEAKSAQDLKIENLVLLGHTAPPEVAADLLLTLAATQPTITKAQKKELLEDAFRVAGDAREPIARRPWSLMVDTRSGFKGAAFGLELDKLSLQTRAVTQMIALDKSRARMMFQEIALPKLPDLTCEDSLSYDPGAYYRTALAVSRDCFDENEKKAEAHVQFLAERLENVKSVSQVVPAMKMLVEATLSGDEMSLLMSTLVGALGGISTDARGFAFVMAREPLGQTVWNLSGKAKSQQVPNVDLNRATRAFIVKQMSGEVCQDAPWLDGRQVKLTGKVTELNDLFPNPIVVDDVRPLSFGATAKDRQFWTLPREKQLLMVAKDLRFGGGEEPLTLEQRRTDEWRKKLNDYLDLIEKWEPESEVSAEDYFQEKCNLYGALVDLCPDGAQREVVLRAYAGYLREQNREYKGRIEWILPVKHYLFIIRSMSEAAQRKSLDPWLSSSDAALRAYAELELLGRAGTKSAIP